jgi:hypothetical protein
MIAAVHQTRTIVILVLLFVAGIAGLYYGLRWFGRELRDKPYVANVKLQLRSLAAAEESYRRDSLSYTNHIARVWLPGDSTHGIALRILDADADGFLAEGRHDAWNGRCMIAVGRQAGDSLPPGEPVCHWE